MNLKRQKASSYLNISFIVVIIFFCATTCASTISLDEFTATPLTTIPKELNESPSIAICDQTIHVVWNTENYENSTIYYKKSLNNGKTWENTTDLTPNITHAYHPVIAVYKNTVHIVWIDYRDINSEIYYTRSTDNGNTWDTAQRLTFDSPIKNSIYDIVICTDGDNVYISWKDYRTGSSEIFFKKSRDSGTTWNADQRLTADYSPSYCPSLAIDGNYLYIAYQDGGLEPDICLLKSESSGDEWNEKTYIVETPEASKKPRLTVLEHSLYLVWQDDKTGAEEIYFKTSTDHGETWGETQQLSYYSTSSINPTIYVYDDYCIVLWQDLINETFSISYTTSTDNGKTWTESRQLTTDTDCYFVGICGENDNIHIIYQEYYTGSWADIWHRGNQSKTPTPIIPEPSEPTAKNTPGFQFFVFIITIIVILFTNNIISKKRKK
jgi:hypothetical protein